MRSIFYYIIGIITFQTAYSQIQTNEILRDLDKPIFATSIMLDDEVIFVVEQDGIVKIVNNNSSNPKVFLNITDRVMAPFYPGDERGLLGFALDPDFNANGYFYVNYVNKNNYSIISRFSSQKLIADKNSEANIITIKQPYSNHNGGHLDFGPDGYLYISLGDGGSAGDPEGRARDLESILGKILRIDVKGNLYDIPKDNPFYSSNIYKKEIWHYGLRNVWKFSFDRLNGDMYMGDVGQNNWEEVNYQPYNHKGGIDYGWNIMEGKHCFKEESCNTETSQMPIYEYPNNANYIKTLIGIKQSNKDGCSITGGYVYRGENIPEIYGRYIFGDYCTGKVWSFENNETLEDNFIDHTQEILQSMNKQSFYLSSFGQRYNGELFLVDYNGYLYEIIPPNNK